MANVQETFLTVYMNMNGANLKKIIRYIPSETYESTSGRWYTKFFRLYPIFIEVKQMIEYKIEYYRADVDVNCCKRPWPFSLMLSVEVFFYGKGVFTLACCTFSTDVRNERNFRDLSWRSFKELSSYRTYWITCDDCHATE